MKKIVLALTIALIGSSAVMAQDNNRRARGPRDQKAMTTADRVERMSQELNLSDAQKKELTKIFEDEAKEMKSDCEKMGKRHKQTQEKVMKVLTPEQQTKFKEGRQKHSDKGDMRGKGHKGHKGKGFRGKGARPAKAGAKVADKAADKACCADKACEVKAEEAVK